MHDVLDMGVHGITHHRLLQKDWKESYYTRAKRACELHIHFSCHHRANGKAVPVHVGDISKVEGWEGALQRPGSSLQYLLDCSVPFEQRWGCNLPDFMSLDPNQSAILLGNRAICVADDHSNPKLNGVSGHPFLPLKLLRCTDWKSQNSTALSVAGISWELMGHSHTAAVWFHHYRYPWCRNSHEVEGIRLVSSKKGDLMEQHPPLLLKGQTCPLSNSLAHVDGRMASVGSESVSSKTIHPSLTGLTRKGTVRDTTHNTIVSKLPKTEQSAPRGKTHKS